MPVPVRIEGSDSTFDGQPGDDLLEVLHANGVPIATSCGGVASCGMCQVIILSGSEMLAPRKPQELVHLGSVPEAGARLACQARLLGSRDTLIKELVLRVCPVEPTTA
jgi:2Fe-2S ferredoxin